MTKKMIVILITISFVCGLLTIAIKENFLIIRLPAVWQSTALPTNTTTEHKKAQLFYWQHDKWYSETVDLIWPEQKEQVLKYLIDRWLSLLDEEQIMRKKITLQSIILSPEGHEAYLSFDQYPFETDQTIFQKMMWIEALLKTIRDNGVQVQSVRFLVHHQELRDYHLDFSNAWPVIGFITSKAPVH
jgi:hypothetical protein